METIFLIVSGLNPIQAHHLVLDSQLMEKENHDYSKQDINKLLYLLLKQNQKCTFDQQTKREIEEQESYNQATFLREDRCLGTNSKATVYLFHETLNPNTTINTLTSRGIVCIGYISGSGVGWAGDHAEWAGRGGTDCRNLQLPARDSYRSQQCKAFYCQNQCQR